MRPDSPPDGRVVLDALANDSRFKQLIPQSRPFNLFRALRIERAELAHSDLLAALLQPGFRTGFAPRLLAHLLELASESAEPEDVRNRLLALSRRALAAKVYRERWFVDLVIEVPDEAIVIGIENKIDAWEQPEQIDRYQKALSDHRSNAFALFLTPDGREPTTASTTSTVPCVAIPWKVVADALRRTADETEHLSDRAVLEQFANHLEEDVIDDEATKQRARELWRDHREAINLLLRSRPRLDELRDQFIGRVRDRIPDAEFKFYPRSRGSLQEIKFRVPEWQRRGIEFTLMLRQTSDGLLGVHLLLWHEEFERAMGLYKDFAERSSKLGEIRIDRDFATVYGWGYWRTVIAGLHQSGEILKKQFDDGTIEEAVGQIFKWKELMDPIVLEMPVVG